MTSRFNKNPPYFLKVTFAWTLIVLFFLWVHIVWGPVENLFFLLLWVTGTIGIYLSQRYSSKNNLAATVDEKASQMSGMIYHAILETSPDSIAVTDLTGNFLFCSKQTALLHGYDSPDELIGRSAFELFPMTQVIRAAKYMQITRQGGLAKNIEFILMRKDGTKFHAELSAALIQDRFGLPVAFMAITRDITDRKFMEEQIKESETRYRIVADNNFDWEFWQAPNDRFIYSSPSCKRITDHESSEFIRNADLFMHIVHPDDRENFEKHHREVNEQRIDGEAEFRITMPDGSEKWISHVCQPVFDKNKNFLGTRGSNRDVTERKKVADELHIANKQLRLQLTEIEGLHTILRDQAIRDPLTGLYNRRYMEEALKQEIARAAREGYPISIAMLDMDGLKGFNDTYGHAMGDRALQILSNQLMEMTRVEDIVCRYGGDEFLVILHNLSLENAFTRVEQWRKTIEKIQISYQDAILQLTFTGGVATYPVHGKTIEEVQKKADDSLYEAKRAGRNYVVMAL